MIDWQAYAKLSIAWVGTIVSVITLQHLLMLATLVFTVLQIWFLIEDRARKRRRRPNRRYGDSHAPIARDVSSDRPTSSGNGAEG